VKEPELPSCPTIEVDLPERQKPLEAMGTGPTWPQIPQGFEFWSGEEKAKWLTERWAIAAEAFAVCQGKKQGLIDWIGQ
jgi:hypothetical protein